MRVAPYSPAWSTRIIEAQSARLLPGATVRSSRRLKVSQAIAAAPPSDRIAFHAGHRNTEERPLHLVAANERHLHDLLEQAPRCRSAPVLVQVVKPSKIRASTPA
jgi:hypothetical protein